MTRSYRVVVLGCVVPGRRVVMDEAEGTAEELNLRSDSLAVGISRYPWRTTKTEAAEVFFYCSLNSCVAAEHDLERFRNAFLRENNEAKRARLRSMIGSKRETIKEEWRLCDILAKKLVEHGEQLETVNMTGAK